MPSTSPIAAVATYPGYQVIVFPHDAVVFSALIVRPAADRAPAGLRGTAAYEAAVAAIPLLAEWTDPDRAAPHSPVLAGAGQHNSYRGQLDDDGGVALPGMLAVGDAVCTTNPAAGRGVALARHDPADAALAFDAWCAEQVRPWFADHVAVDAAQLRRWAGEDVDLTRSLPSDVVCAVTEADPSLLPVLGPCRAMRALPASLATVEPRAREV